MSATPIDRTELLTLCELARLHLPAEREGEVQGHLQRIVSAFAALRSVDTAGVAADASIGPARMPLRGDVPGAVLPREAVLGNAARSTRDSFVVPRVVDA